MLRLGKLIRNFVLVTFVGLSAIGIFGVMIMPKAPEIAKEPNKDELEKRYIEYWRMTAQLHTAEQGSSMFA